MGVIRFSLPTQTFHSTYISPWRHFQRTYASRKKPSIFHPAGFNVASLETYYRHFNLFKHRSPTEYDGSLICSSGDQIIHQEPDSLSFISAFGRKVFKCADDGEFLDECVERRGLQLERNASLPFVFGSTWNFPMSVHAVSMAEFFFYEVLPLLSESLHRDGSVHVSIDDDFVESTNFYDYATAFDYPCDTAAVLYESFLQYLAHFRQFVEVIRVDGPKDDIDEIPTEDAEYVCHLLLHPDIVFEQFRVFQRMLKLPLPLLPDTPKQVTSFPVYYRGDVFHEELDEAEPEPKAQSVSADDPVSRIARLQPLFEKLKEKYAKAPDDETLKRIHHIAATIKKQKASLGVEPPVESAVCVIEEEIPQKHSVESHPIYNIMNAM